MGSFRYAKCDLYSRRNILGAISVRDKIAYHLFILETHAARAADRARLCRKEKWPMQYRLLGIQGIYHNFTID